MKRILYTSLMVILVAALASCPAGSQKALSLDEAKINYAHNSEIVSMIDSATEVMQFCASEYGIKTEKNLLKFLPGSATALTWELTAVSPMTLKPVTSLVFTNQDAALAKKTALEKEGKEVFITTRNPLVIGNKLAPLLEAWVSWPYERKIERVMQLIMYRFAVKTLKRKDADTLACFLAEKATEEFLRKKISPASPILARYISEQRDARTFESLFPDFVERIHNLYAHKDPSLDAEAILKTREMLLNTWIANYRQNYTNRFLTNAYVQFGNPLPSDAELAAFSFKYKNWKTYANLFTEAQENVSQMLILIKKTR
ncbi:MAG TPA: aminopeptidase [Spirochaetales bacterium]|nr:aminopeptidase [Spirochaetales bacterium]HPD81452.1 aminopeptidase [Spirochaetales bacterium]HQG40911.1 aminopeptidase [Spirochaetales bacterium]HQK33618.1 aminopeptidase [Spirochaetales bacterium]